jgi:DNA repair and recombination protein RAD54B
VIVPSCFEFLSLALQAINSLKKLCNHPGLVYDEAREFAGSEPKSAYSYYPPNYVPLKHFSNVEESSKLAVLDHLLAAVRAENNKIVVVSNYIQTLDMLAVYLQSKNYEYLRLDGQTPASERQGLVDRFNAPYHSDAFVFLLSAKAGGVSRTRYMTLECFACVLCIADRFSSVATSRFLLVRSD